ncbi:MAG: cbb3-type cytochrome c oxidase subunit 3 [Gammaproteobacteria bacterium]|nr:cbb3-type cytochrome c oxidase subunit 3 [Gammaproteobacteria bacterium]
MDIGAWHGLWSLLILGLFIGIVAWVWSGRRKDYYEQAGRIPLQDDDE